MDIDTKRVSTPLSVMIMGHGSSIASSVPFLEGILTAFAGAETDAPRTITSCRRTEALKMESVAVFRVSPYRSGGLLEWFAGWRERRDGLGLRRCGRGVLLLATGGLSRRWGGFRHYGTRPR